MEIIRHKEKDQRVVRSDVSNICIWIEICIIVVLLFSCLRKPHVLNRHEMWY